MIPYLPGNAYLLIAALHLTEWLSVTDFIARFSAAGRLGLAP
jgi:hypothetical protein